MANSPQPPSSESTGLNLKKFNSTSVTTTTEVITPKLSSADKGRRALMVVVVIVALGLIGAIAFRSSGFNPFEGNEHGPGLAVPERRMPQ